MPKNGKNRSRQFLEEKEPFSHVCVCVHATCCSSKGLSSVHSAWDVQGVCIVCVPVWNSYHEFASKRRFCCFKNQRQAITSLSFKRLARLQGDCLHLQKWCYEFCLKHTLGLCQGIYKVLVSVFYGAICLSCVGSL